MVMTDGHQRAVTGSDMGVEERRKEEERRRARRVAFAENLQAILDARQLTHREFAALNGWPNHTRLYPWLRAHAEPDAEAVFAMEETLKLEPGTLSRPLGYVPADNVPKPWTRFEEMVDAEAMLTEAMKRAIKALWAELVQPGPQEPPPPGKRAARSDGGHR
jgi:transcriptional regulator with XRE-family HTH domain